MTIEQIIAVFDPCDIIESQVLYRVEEEGLDEKSARDQVGADPDIMSFAFEDACEALTDVMHEINPEGYWKVTGRNLGWRNLTGTKVFEANTGMEMVNACFPDTDLTFRFTRDGDIIHATCSHHDSPTGEFYEIVADSGEDLDD